MITDSTQIILNNGGATQKSTEAVTKNNQALIESNNQTEKIAKNQNELKSQTLTNIQETTQATIDSTNITLSFIEERQKTALERAKLFIGAFGEDIKNTFQDTLSAVGALASAFAGEDEERQRKAFDLNKKLAIVQTTISTIEATVNAFKKAQENPLNEATAGAYAFTRAAIAAAFGVAQIAQIQSQKFGSYTQPSVQGQAGGGSFGASLNAPAVRLPRTEQFTGDRRVYVTEYDISNTQEKVKVTEDVSIVK